METMVLTPPWFDRAETLKTQVLDRLEAMVPEDRCVSPGPGEWSAEQVVAHLVLVEELLVGDWHAAAQAAPGTKPGWRGALMVGIVSTLMASPLRMPTVPGLEPEETPDPRALPERWGAVRARLRSVLPAEDSALWIVHPIFGPLSCPRMGNFLVAHLRYHLRHWPGNSRANPGYRKQVTYAE